MRPALLLAAFATIALAARAAETAPAAPAPPAVGQVADLAPKTPPAPTSRDEILVLVGAPGEDTYLPGFAAAADNWKTAATRAHANYTVIGLDPQKDPEAAPTDKTRVEEWFKKLDPASPATVWIAYIGHGTFDGKDARLNLRGPDFLPAEVAALLKPLTRPVVFVHGGSASAPFLNALSAPGRIIITATRSGNEVNYARFGERFAEAVASDDADIDQDGQVSLLEAFVTAAQKVSGFYGDEGRMMSEHALLDDNGDKSGTSADFFKGTRVVKQAQPARGGGAAPTVDNARARLVALVPSDAERAMTAEQLAQRAQLEKQLDTLRAQKPKLAEAAYYAALEKILRQLAPLYASAPAPATPTPKP